MPIEQQAVQSIHAAIETAKAFPEKLEPHPHLCLCAVRNEARLTHDMNKLKKLGIQLREFYEPDRNNELTAFATEPLRGDDRKHFRNFQLLKKETI